MDFKKFDLLLKKINTLKQNMDLSGDDVSELEVDLLKNYIRQLYEVVALPGEDAPKHSHKAKPTEILSEKPGFTEPEPPKTVIIREEKPVEVVRVTETVRELVPPSKAPEIIAPVVQKAVEIPVEPLVPVAQPKLEKEFEIPVELADIFSTDPSTDLSDKLSSAPLEDIKKAIAINDRILTINDLFGGSKELFDETVTFVNKSNSFEEATNWIIQHVAIKNKWGVADRKGKAKRFIKLVRRRLPQ